MFHCSMVITTLTLPFSSSFRFTCITLFSSIEYTCIEIIGFFFVFRVAYNFFSCMCSNFIDVSSPFFPRRLFHNVTCFVHVSLNLLPFYVIYDLYIVRLLFYSLTLSPTFLSLAFFAHFHCPTGYVVIFILVVIIFPVFFALFYCWCFCWYDVEIYFNIKLVLCWLISMHISFIYKYIYELMYVYQTIAILVLYLDFAMFGI